MRAREGSGASSSGPQLSAAAPLDGMSMRQRRQMSIDSASGAVYLDDGLDVVDAAAAASDNGGDGDSSAATAAAATEAASARQRQRAAAARAWTMEQESEERSDRADSATNRQGWRWSGGGGGGGGGGGSGGGGGGGGDTGDYAGIGGGGADSGIDDDAEEDDARRAHKKAQRDAETVTQEMLDEVKELLHLLGVPYLVAPMEAEAQCVELERLGLVDGIVTDDSDAFVFGAKAVYKNIFEDQKYVEAYLLPDITAEFGISTPHLRALALLMGSDYTLGIKNVGLVNAMEIVRAFPLRAGEASPAPALRRFKEWLDGFDPLGDAQLEKRVARAIREGPEAEEREGVTLAQRFHLKHRSARNRWIASPSFPSEEVLRAYEKPQAAAAAIDASLAEQLLVTSNAEAFEWVTSNAEAFEWVMPDAAALRRLCDEVLGWPRGQTEALLDPVMARLKDRSFQPRLDSYYTSYHANARFAKIRSMRLRQAVAELSGREPEPTLSLMPLIGGPTDAPPQEAALSAMAAPAADGAPAAAGAAPAKRKRAASAGGAKKPRARKGSAPSTDGGAPAKKDAPKKRKRGAAAAASAAAGSESEAAASSAASGDLKLPPKRRLSRASSASVSYAGMCQDVGPDDEDDNHVDVGDGHVTDDVDENDDDSA
ncbi:hypothetical protein JKP88DRAFT_348118 [Tribonema minus]|uniref:XPG-I domain-containing protein n=1 Tax=Tribonema minus TaxID=303371 RepID=A0A836CHS7_9STRA|nr:hypothetical protein JKP88DRAFT_348118 [Tribonema minus]